MSDSVIGIPINSLTFLLSLYIFFDNVSRHHEWRIHKPDTGLMHKFSELFNYSIIFLFTC